VKTKSLQNIETGRSIGGEIVGEKGIFQKFDDSNVKIEKMKGTNVTYYSRLKYKKYSTYFGFSSMWFKGDMIKEN
jgi:hypothetical protein